MIDLSISDIKHDQTQRERKRENFLKIMKFFSPPLLVGENIYTLRRVVS